MQEFNRMILHADYNLNLRLDHAADDYAKSIQEELALSAKESSRLLRFAEGELRIELMELRRQELEEELAQFKRDVAKKMELERIEKEKREADEREKQRLEAIKREEEEEQRKKAEEEEAKRKAEVEAEERRKAAQAKADLQAKAKAEADAAAAEKAKQEAAQEAARQAALQAQQAQKAQQVIQQSAATPFAPAAQPSTVPLSTLSAALAERKATLLPEHEITHNRYLKLHQDLKPFRKQVKDYAKGRMDLEAVEKGWLGELRREVRTKAGQISSTNKANNTKAVSCWSASYRRHPTDAASSMEFATPFESP
jgi:nucleoporin GLE1